VPMSCRLLSLAIKVTIPPRRIGLWSTASTVARSQVEAISLFSDHPKSAISARPLVSNGRLAHSDIPERGPACASSLA
jgi:hypothetical protein